ncbi:uncharacterized protein LOC101737601 isoform X1 [Bombyx mori]|uniref:Uncharacterized protein n=1 Tax=Bombyx mori TaxID=7091 RepID=A0A8R2C8J9_BOMMO|nr:uncharacterized protein LOC101737601 [Bombyx mori]
MKNSKSNSKADQSDDDDFKHTHSNNFKADGDYMNSLQNARSVLAKLEKTIYKTSKYETMLSRCKSGHTHSHSLNELWESDFTEDTHKLKSKTEINRNDVARSWSTMSIVCLQYQYDELTKRYESLLQAFNERCDAVNTRDNALNDLQKRLNTCHNEINEVHKTLITVCDKYLALKYKKNVQLSSLNVKIEKLKNTIKCVLKAAEQARIHFDQQLACYLSKEKDAISATLLTEITICNKLFVENLKLKAHINELTSDVRN